jgi:prepilin-type N-terminal cleavage/methylation domain-containing protein
MKRKPHGFTLVETLVTVSIIAALVAAGAAGINSARHKAKCAVEIHAARNLITAYLSHAAENGGKVLAGYQADASVTNLEGQPLHYPMNARYPWRLVPSVPKIDGVMLFNGNESALKSENRDYLVSVHPNLGLNATLVGGHFGTGSPMSPTPKMLEAFGRFHLTRLSDSSASEKLLVFASARSGNDQTGYFEIRPPNLNRRVWSPAQFSKETPPSSHGFVDLRWDGRAVCAMLGGNIELLDETRLRDMRRWSIQAEAANAPSFMLSPR